MKKVMFLMAVAGMFAFAACNNTPAEEAVVDSPAVEEMVEETPDVDSTAVEAVEAVAEEVVAE